MNDNSPLEKQGENHLKNPAKGGEGNVHEFSTAVNLAKQQVVQLVQQMLFPVSVEVVFGKAFGEDPFKTPGNFPSFTATDKDVTTKWWKIDSGYELRAGSEPFAFCVVKVSGRGEDWDEKQFLATLETLGGPILLILQTGALQQKITDRESPPIPIESDEKSPLVPEHKLFQELYDRAPFAYVNLDQNGIISFVNRPWMSSTGYGLEEVTGRPFVQFLGEYGKELFQKKISEVFAEKNDTELELDFVKKDGSQVWFQISYVIVKDDDNGVGGYHLSCISVSGQGRIKEIILQSEKLASIAGLAAGIAHEINTPLSGILQSVQLIEMFLDPENKNNVRLAEESGVDLKKLQVYLQQQDLDYFIDGIRGSAIKASKIIRSLLDFSRPTQTKFELVQISDLIDLVLRLVQSDYDLKKKHDVINTQFTTEYDAEVPYIHCVPVEIEQVVLNVVKNSVYALSKAKTESPEITIRTLRFGDKIRIEIEDNGPGLPPEVKKHAFDPFYSTKGHGEGTGLGLSVSHTYVTDKHHGAIWIESEVSKGAKVVVELPIESVEFEEQT